MSAVAEKARTRAPLKPGETVRPCLNCNKPFKSAGAHQRLCPICRRIATTPFDL